MSATSQLKHIRRLNQTAPAIERPACNGRPQNNCVGLASSAPRKRFVQQFFAQSVVPHFGNNIKIGQVRMQLGLVNGVRYFLNQLHANVAEQPFAIVADPAAPRAGARTNTLPHPRCASAHEPRLRFRHRAGFRAKSITHLSHGTAISQSCQANPHASHRQIVPDSTSGRHS